MNNNTDPEMNPSGCKTCDQLRTLYEREKAKNQKLMAVVVAAKDALFDYTQLMNRIAEVQAHEVFSDDFTSKSRKGGMKLVKALAALEEK